MSREVRIFQRLVPHLLQVGKKTKTFCYNSSSFSRRFCGGSTLTQALWSDGETCFRRPTWTGNREKRRNILTSVLLLCGNNDQNRAFPHDVTAPILAFPNGVTAAMLIYQTNPVGTVPFVPINLGAGYVSLNATLFPGFLFFLPPGARRREILGTRLVKTLFRCIVVTEDE